MLKWSHLIGIRKLWRFHSPGTWLEWKGCYGFTCWVEGPECGDEGGLRSSVCYQHPSFPLSLSAHLSCETSLTISQCSRSANAFFSFFFFFYKRCSARQQGVPCLRLMSTQMQADSSGINNLISLHLYFFSSVCFLCVSVFSRLYWLIKGIASRNVCFLFITP